MTKYFIMYGAESTLQEPGMSDTSFSAINRPIIPIGIIDETWANDTLSDDGKLKIWCKHFM